MGDHRCHGATWRFVRDPGVLFLWCAPALLAIEAGGAAVICLAAVTAAGLDVYRTSGLVFLDAVNAYAEATRSVSSDSALEPQMPTQATPMPVANPSAAREERIKLRAYELWEGSGYAHGRHDEHWHRAVEEIDGRTGG